MASKIDLKLIKGDIMEFARNFCEAGAYKASIEIEAKASLALQESYYDQYSPSYYFRTEQLLKDSHRMFVLKDSSGLSSGRICYMGGIHIDNFGINYRPRGLSNEQIIFGSWYEGYHGHEVLHVRRYASNGVPYHDIIERPIITKPSPREYLEKIVFSNKFKKEIKNYAMGVAKARKYRFLRFN